MLELPQQIEMSISEIITTILFLGVRVGMTIFMIRKELKHAKSFSILSGLMFLLIRIVINDGYRLSTAFANIFVSDFKYYFLCFVLEVIFVKIVDKFDDLKMLFDLKNKSVNIKGKMEEQPKSKS